MNKLLYAKKYHLKNIIIKYIILLLPFIGYGIYKNGYLLYIKSIINFLDMFKVIYLILIGFVLSVLKNILLKKKIHWGLDILIPIVVPLFMPYNINYLYYVIGYIVGLTITILIEKRIHINKIALLIVTIFVLLIITQGLNFLNPLENQNIYSFNTFDLLWGRTYGGICATWIIYAYIFVLLASFLNNYKYIIPIVSIIVYILFSLLLGGFSYKIFTNSFAIISIILLNIDTRCSPITLINKIIYGIVLGLVISLCFIYLKNPLWVFISEFLVSLSYEIIAKYRRVCYNMNDFLEKN